MNFFTYHKKYTAQLEKKTIMRKIYIVHLVQSHQTVCLNYKGAVCTRDPRMLNSTWQSISNWETLMVASSNQDTGFSNVIKGSKSSHQWVTQQDVGTISDFVISNRYSFDIISYCHWILIRYQYESFYIC